MNQRQLNKLKVGDDLISKKDSGNYYLLIDINPEKTLYTIQAILSDGVENYNHTPQQMKRLFKTQ